VAADRSAILEGQRVLVAEALPDCSEGPVNRPTLRRSCLPKRVDRANRPARQLTARGQVVSPVAPVDSASLANPLVPRGLESATWVYRFGESADSAIPADRLLMAVGSAIRANPPNQPALPAAAWPRPPARQLMAIPEDQRDLQAGSAARGDQPFGKTGGRCESASSAGRVQQPAFLAIPVGRQAHVLVSRSAVLAKAVSANRPFGSLGHSAIRAGRARRQHRLAASREAPVGRQGRCAAADPASPPVQLPRVAHQTSANRAGRPVVPPGSATRVDRPAPRACLPSWTDRCSQEVPMGCRLGCWSARSCPLNRANRWRLASLLMGPSL
jgi:hypothetical protein